MAFEFIFKKYYLQLYYFSFQIVKNKNVAEDLVQESFMKFWERQSTEMKEGAIKNYLYSTVRNASLNVIRHARVAQNYIDQQAENFQTDENIVHAMIREEVLSEIHDALAALPTSCQRISRLGYLQGLKNKEIAHKLGISVNTVKTQKQRGLFLLRSKLKHTLFC